MSKSGDEAKLEQLAKKLLRTKPKPRQEYEGKGKKPKANKDAVGKRQPGVSLNKKSNETR